MRCFIGTYTSSEGSKGIYSAVFHTTDGALSQLELAAELPNPSYLAFHPNGKTAYAVLEATAGEIAVLEHSSGALRRIGTAEWNGGGPCHVYVEPSGQYVYACAYGGGSIAAFACDEDGLIAKPSAVFQNQGTGPNRNRQEAPHLHAATTAANGTVFACDLGTDEVLAFKAGGSLEPAYSQHPRLTPGAGPRHLVSHPHLSLLYVNGELDSTVNVFQIEGDQTPAVVQRLSTLPAGVDPKTNSCAGIYLGQGAQHLYIGNRGHDSFAVYRINPDGLLEFLGCDSATVQTPRGAAISPDGRFLLCGGQTSHDVAVLELDPSTGRLTPTGHRLAVASPVCLAFG